MSKIQVIVTNNAVVVNDWILETMHLQRRCLLFQLLHRDGLPTFLAKFLGDPNVTFEVCGKMGWKKRCLLGKVMEKPMNVTLSKWDVEVLCGKESRQYLNCHYQQPLLLLQDTQGMFHTLALF
ncbi:hypothetical protein R3W88_022030 [Solanum pinnatisectum]|uniref:Uncharacterized protein n=1 Tax=Solanum pinnatisectum TaxID=50273 RepID=A0AAV9LXE5_9SOLN|nr:hypothetical protein R3W88_022030 [Solanum pinnatisectum]